MRRGNILQLVTHLTHRRGTHGLKIKAKMCKTETLRPKIKRSLTSLKAQDKQTSWGCNTWSELVTRWAWQWTLYHCKNMMTQFTIFSRLKRWFPCPDPLPPYMWVKLIFYPIVIFELKSGNVGSVQKLLTSFAPQRRADKGDFLSFNISWE